MNGQEVVGRIIFTESVEIAAMGSTVEVSVLVFSAPYISCTKIEVTPNSNNEELAKEIPHQTTIVDTLGKTESESIREGIKLFDETVAETRQKAEDLPPF